MINWNILQVSIQHFPQICVCNENPKNILEYESTGFCVWFVGKPKCFFIQACRGSSPQGVVDLPDDKEEVMIDQVVGKIAIPTDADLLLAYATTPGTDFETLHFSSINDN